MATRRGWALWLTGLPASGKTSLARAIQRHLAARRITAAVLDSDALRPILSPGAPYTPEGRDEFYARLVELAVLLAGEGVNLIIAATGNRRAYRDAARARLAPFAEVWLRCPVEVCRRRDPKGLYARASAGAITTLPGLGADYEEPLDPEATVDAAASPPEALAADLVAAVPFLRPRRS